MALIATPQAEHSLAAPITPLRARTLRPTSANNRTEDLPPRADAASMHKLDLAIVEVALAFMESANRVVSHHPNTIFHSDQSGEEISAALTSRNHADQ